MSFSENKKHPYTKIVTIQKFSVSIKGTPDISLQNKVHDALKKLGTNVVDVSENIHIKCRKFEEIDNKLVVFFSWYDDQLDISTTKKNANDKITSKSVNNADICHLFLSLQQDIIWAFSTLATLNLDGRLFKTLCKLLNNHSLIVNVEPDKDVINIIRKEKIKFIGVEGNFDLLALGFQEKNFFSLFESEESKKRAEQIHYGTLMIDKKGNPKIIKNIEENPDLALSYMTDYNNFDNKKNIYIQTSKRKIDGGDLKKRHVLYLKPNGKTKTVHWSDAKATLLSIND